MWLQQTIRVMVIFIVAACGAIITPRFDRDSVVFGANRTVVPKVADEVHVRVDGELLSLSEAVRRASSDRQLTEYRQLRITNSSTAIGQLGLAQWCRKYGLVDEERLHWRILLAIQPDHPEAIKRLGLRKYKGWLLTPDEIKKARAKEKQLKRVAKIWTPRLKKIRGTMKHGDATEREAAMRELQSIKDPLAIPSIEEVFSNEGPDIISYVLGMFAEMLDQQATDFLVRQAVQSEHPEVREQAADMLRYRSYEDYVPSLIAGLAAPIEMISNMSMEPGGQILWTYNGPAPTNRLYPAFPNKIRLRSKYTIEDVAYWTFAKVRISETFFTGYSPDHYRLQYSLSRESMDSADPHEISGEIGGANDSVRDSAEDLKRRIREVNAATAQRNQRIHEALTKATDLDAVPDQIPEAKNNKNAVNPRYWWEWWRKQNNLNNYFAQGMEVWTQAGLLPIEKIMIGDRVLTRDSASGELTFNLVIGWDMQPQNVMHRIEVDSRTIVATPDQPIFVTGEGWRKANELQEDMQLDSLAGPRRIAAVGPGVAVNTYNLMVENSSNYFVDRKGIQVSDATPINSKR